MVVYEWQYDECGKLIEFTDIIRNEVFTYTYDEYALTNVSSNLGFKVSYSDDENFFGVSYEYGGVYKEQKTTESEEKDENGNDINVTSISLISGDRLVSVVSSEENVQSTLYSNEDTLLSSKYTYSEERLEKIVYQDGKILECTYDNAGNIISVAENGNVKLRYEYDSLGQLIRENNAYANKTYLYKYDNSGNILESSEYAYSEGEPSNATSKKKYGYEDDDWKDLLTSFNGQVITYDEIGNPLNYRDNMKFTWAGRMLSSVKVGSDEISYTYNSEGIRTSKCVNGVTIQYNLEGTKIVSESTENSIIWYIYDENDRVIGFEYGDKVFYFEKNAQGDVIRIYDETGNVVCEYIYDAWGNVIDIQGEENIAKINPFRYRGYYQDNETGFYYLQSRYYDSYVGRFLNADAMVILDATFGFNLFTYCENNPILYIDPDGYAKTYVIYYNRKNTGFTTQAYNSPYYNKNSNNVYMIGVLTAQDFIDAWNSMSGTIDCLYLYLHGGKGVLYFYGEEIGFSGEYTFDDLESKKIKKTVYLLSCKGGAGSEGSNVAWKLAKLTSCKVYACTGSVSFSKILGKYYARKSAKDLGIIKTFYYEKKYIYWGSVVAKSKAGQW